MDFANRVHTFDLYSNNNNLTYKKYGVISASAADQKVFGCNTRGGYIRFNDCHPKCTQQQDAANTGSTHIAHSHPLPHLVVPEACQHTGLRRTKKCHNLLALLVGTQIADSRNQQSLENPRTQVCDAQMGVLRIGAPGAVGDIKTADLPTKNEFSDNQKPRCVSKTADKQELRQTSSNLMREQPACVTNPIDTQTWRKVPHDKSSEKRLRVSNLADLSEPFQISNDKTCKQTLLARNQIEQIAEETIRQAPKEAFPKRFFNRAKAESHDLRNTADENDKSCGTDHTANDTSLDNNSSMPHIAESDLESVKLIAEGGSGRVYHVKHKDTGENFALKEMRLDGRFGHSRRQMRISTKNELEASKKVTGSRWVVNVYVHV